MQSFAKPEPLMKHRYFFLLLISFSVFRCTQQSPGSGDEYDLVVYGGTPAGVMAAYSASKLGRSVVLIEPSGHIGGLTTGGLGHTDIGNKYAVTGLGRDFYRRVGQQYSTFEQWQFEPHVAMNVMMSYLSEAGITPLLHLKLVNLSVDEGIIETITVENESGEQRRLRGKVFVDATYEGDLLAEAGVSYFVGREANSVYGETYNGTQFKINHNFPDGVDPYNIPGKPESGLVWGISAGGMPEDGLGDKMVQAYNYRICLTNDPENLIPITRPSGYDSTQFELLVRLFQAQPEKRSLSDYFIWSLMPNHKTDINNRGGFSTDMIGMNHSYPEADYDERQKIIKDHTRYTKALLYFFGHDPRVPEELRSAMLQWGYPKDEYTENGNWTPQLYIREARRMIGSYMMTEHNCLGDSLVDDGIALAAYTMDSHHCQRVVMKGPGGKDQVKNEGCIEIGGFTPYPIAYRSLTPKIQECKNLLVPVCLSASHIAFGSIRMEPVFMVLGQVTGVAASMAVDGDVPVQQIDVKQLQETLVSDPLLNGTPPDVLVDDADEKLLTRKGSWEKEEHFMRNYKSSLLIIHDSSDIANNSLRFQVPVEREGRYRVYYYCPRFRSSDAEYPGDLTAEIFDGQTGRMQKFSYTENLGSWADLGEVVVQQGSTPYVEVIGSKSDYPLIADAVLFLPERKNEQNN
jgi:hypothetical protein